MLLVLFLFVIPFCSSLPLRWNATFTYEHKTKRKMGLLLAHRPNFARKVVQNSKSLFVDGHDRWFIYSVASDVDGAMLSANLCASLLRHVCFCFFLFLFVSFCFFLFLCVFISLFICLFIDFVCFAMVLHFFPHHDVESKFLLRTAR